MSGQIAVIGGVSFDLPGEDFELETPFGQVMVRRARLGSREVLFVSRHGQNHLPPHRVEYRAILWAVSQAGADRVISVNTVGSMAHHPPGSFFIPLDFVEFTRSRKNTFYEDRAVHVDLSQPYCPQVRLALAGALRSAGMEPFEGVYVCTEGPHLESPAQIRMMSQFGEVVGMTGYPEVVLARELELCYASLCIVTNPACGLGQGALSLAEVVINMQRSLEMARDVLARAVELLPKERHCDCRKALEGAGL
ncbi:MAG: MTAP family purine nucleoside phosphorylase [Methanosarcinales archaeon]|nr:MTAP family purine nucleoside phosphorylase [Methanosarcinales archaeon]